ncbi:hypothetical protein Cantr_00998 [Candida viswanathii]|uniref:Uncharacterized protein n=1 Tax=Candida viswanathii TaxID=5486 RepID=A0A367YH11_9ASCO|nr:hypothetical protein Cantr_00998 [Candida viswanathii]
MTDSTTNELKQRIGDDKFQQAVQFYEADRRLTPEDRAQLRDDIKKVLVVSNSYGYAAGLVAFLMPTVYFRFFNKAKLNPKAFIQRPLLSVGLGVANLYFMYNVYANNLYNEMLDSGLPENQLEIWRNMERYRLGIYMFYYTRSAQDPAVTLPDPRTFTSDMAQVRFDPERYKQAEGPDHVLTTWDKIRLSNGLDITPEESKPASAWDEVRRGK